MDDERKDQNLPAKPTSSLMGQLVRQRQASEVVPAQQQNTGLAGGQAGTNVGARPGAAPPPGQSGMARPGGGAPQTGVAGSGGRPGGGGVPATEGPTRSDIERIDAKDEYGGYGHGGGGGGEASPTDVGGKFSANQQLIREREKFIIEQLRRELDTSRLTNISEDTQAQVRARIREIVNSDPAPLTMMEKGILLQNVLDEVFGFGPLGPLLRDPSVGDICVNNVNSVYVERHGRLEKTSVVFENDRHLRQTIDKIIQPLGRRLDENSPMVDARLPNGSRVNATIPPVTIDGPTITIRCFGTSIMSLGQLVEKGAMSVQMAEVLKSCVKGRINLIISGGTGSGKTTLLNALSAHINPR